MASGEDAIGDISVIPAGRQPGEAAPAADLAKLDQTVFSELFEKSIGQEASAPEPTIPGVQQKLSAAVLSFPLRGRQKQRAYILKLNPPDKPRLVENEEFFLRAARDCGLVVPSAKIIQDRTVQTGLLIERFDRLPAKKREELTRVHQEDACQFLDRYPADKYRITCSEIAEGLSLCSAPVIETAKLIRLIAFSYLIGNGDLHAKNVSIHTSPQSSRIEMTPAYDLVTTYPYGDTRMALKFEGRDDNFRRRYFLDFGVRYGVREPVTKTILDELVEAIEPWIRRLGEIGFAEKKTKQLEELIRKRREDLGR
jgi:serine/threonine-protein kinase HipA